jgi:hypothetical protein
VAWIGLDATSQLEQLPPPTSSLPCDAAACAISLAEQEPHLAQEHLGHAIEFLDHGRSILLSQACNLRLELKELRKQNQRLADELESIGHALLRGNFCDLKENTMTEEDSQAHRRSARRFEQLIDEARQLTDFEHFLRRTPIAELRSAAADGPVIIINMSKYRCDAVIIRSHADELIHMPLSTKMTDINLLAENLSKAVMTFERGETLYVDPVVLKDALNKIWSLLGRPIIDKLEALRELKPDSLSRVWWCVTGMLTFFPIHAAFPRSHPKKRGQEG